MVAFRFVIAQQVERNETFSKHRDIRIEWDSSTLQQLAPRGGRQLNYAGYPRVKRFRDGTAVAVYEADGNTELISSVDAGKTWSNPVVTFRGYSHTDAHGNEVKVNMANPEIIELENGDWVAACNYRPRRDEVVPFAIAISRSRDRGKTWSEPQVIYEAEPRFKDGCWEPAFLQLPDGTLQVYFANEAPYTASDEQEISMLASADNGQSWDTEPQTVSFRAGRRDGMPVPLLIDGEILVAIEDNKEGQFQPYIVRTGISDNWKAPVTADSPMREYALKDALPDSVYAGAPYLARLTTGEVLLSYQTTKGRGTDWEKSTMEVAIGDKTGRNFQYISQPFPVPTDREAKWNAITVWDDTTVVATSATNFDGGRIGAWMIFGRIVSGMPAAINQTDR
ncbi:BNR repeat-like domain-containing protein [Parapedobacter composti]|uniref:BNR repeat-like domain-containing protein n=1 Tax=Parapedobacter composti TaxID=623281 RepID=A0A1I1ETZ4_9SPHI|nr:sialidase family protein [Parapedobacter composti]SFB90497.1 BNR repeat-like domain-containing protein [Parapedobacter composti]